MIGNATLEKMAFRLPESVETADLDRQSCVRLAIGRAFPLPDTGSLADLLAAIDEGRAEPA